MDEDMHIGVDSKLTAEEVVGLRKACDWDGDVSEWEVCLKQNLCNVSARTASDKVIGVGFVSGNQRHAELVDLVVHPDYRKNGLGGNIFDLLVEFTQQKGIKYVGLTYDKNTPWLKDFYARHGFESIDFAMWHKDSLKNL